MQYLTFQPDLVKAFPILDQAKVILTDDLDANQVQDLIVNYLLPDPSMVIGTDIRLNLAIVSLTHGFAYWDLIFAFPEGYPTDLLDQIYDNAIELDDSYDHNKMIGYQLCKISFKVG